MIGSSNDDADEMIGNVWALSTSNHGEDLGPVEEKSKEKALFL